MGPRFFPGLRSRKTVRSFRMCGALEVVFTETSDTSTGALLPTARLLLWGALEAVFAETSDTSVVVADVFSAMPLPD